MLSPLWGAANVTDVEKEALAFLEWAMWACGVEDGACCWRGDGRDDLK